MNPQETIDMKHGSKSADKGRREFLVKGIAAVGGAATLVAAGTSGAAETPKAGAKPAAATPRAKGYRETEHIRRYYDLARS
jgi:hypothetical protein